MKTFFLWFALCFRVVVLVVVTAKSLEAFRVVPNFWENKAFESEELFLSHAQCTNKLIKLLIAAVSSRRALDVKSNRIKLRSRWPKSREQPKVNSEEPQNWQSTTLAGSKKPVKTLLQLALQCGAWVKDNLTFRDTLPFLTRGSADRTGNRWSTTPEDYDVSTGGTVICKV